MSVEQLVLIIVLLTAVLFAFLIPAILQIKRAAKSAEDFMKAMLQSLTPLISELRQTIEKTNRAAEGVEESIMNVQRLTRSVGETGALIEEVNNLLRQTGISCAIKTASIGVGIKTAFNVLAKGLIKKGGEKDE